jgi:hypothetical protein
MTRYFVTAWCDRPFYAQCEVEANSPEEALAKARESIHDAPAQECDHGYNWDEWRVDTEEAEGVLLRSDETRLLLNAAPKLLAALEEIVRVYAEYPDETARQIAETALAAATGKEAA